MDQHLHHRELAKPGFRLLDLPPELRNNVYRHIIQKFERKVEQERHARHVRGVFAQIPKKIISFLLSCKTVWRELLSLLFGSYVWTAELSFQNFESGSMNIIPRDSWLLSPSTWRKPTSGNIRHVEFKMNHKSVPHAHLGIYQGWWFAVSVDLMKSAPYFASKVLAHINGGNFMNGAVRCAELRADLERTVRETLTQLEIAKAGSGERVTDITIEEWQEIAMNLKAAYLSLVRRKV